MNNPRLSNHGCSSRLDVMLALGVIMIHASLLAQPNLANPQATSAAQPTGSQQQAGEQTVAPSMDQDSLFDDLLDDLPSLPFEKPAELGDRADKRLLEAYQKMMEARARLGQRKAESQAVQSQQEAIEALDAFLLELLQPMPPEDGSSDDLPPEEPQATEMDSAPPEDQQPAQPDEGDSDDEPSSDRDEEDSGQDANSDATEQAAGDGTDASNDDPPPPSDAEVAKRTAELQQSVWGHLPDRVRQQLQAAMPDSFHPRYQQAIIDYYRSITDPRNSTAR